MAGGGEMGHARLSRRRARFPLVAMVLPLVSVIVAMAIGAVVMAVSHVDPIHAYSVLFQSTFGSRAQFAETLNTTTPLLLIGLGIALAFRAGTFNIGAVGQEYLGAIAAVTVGGKFAGLPAPLHVALAVLAAFVAGGLWATPAAILKIRYGINEVITTILLNYIALYFTDFLIAGPIQAPGFNAAPTSWNVVPSATFPKIVANSDLNASFLLAVLATIVIFVVMRRTTVGQRIRMVGFNREAARHAGVHVDRVFVGTFFVSGALAGLAGGAEILGYRYQLITGFAPSTGYDAIAVALLGGLNPIGVALSAFFFAALANGAVALEAIAQLPAQLADIIRTLAILVVLATSSPVILSMLRRLQTEPQIQVRKETQASHAE
jgi:ABC-type uncharacterized transport system permease subunit